MNETIKHLKRVLLTALFSLVFLPVANSHSVLPRSIAAASIDQSIAEVRNNIDSNPDLVADRLGDSLALPVGDDPRVIALCAEIVSHAHNLRSIQSAIGALDIVSTHWRPIFWNTSTWEKSVAAALEPALKNGNADIRFHAAGVLAGLGGNYEIRAFKLLSDALPTPDRDVAFQYMVPTFGDRPEVIDIAIAGARTGSAQDAPRAFEYLHSIIQARGGPSKRSLKSDQRARIVSFLTDYLKSDDKYRALLAADVLRGAEPASAGEVRAACRRIMSSPLAADDVRVRGKILDVILKHGFLDSNEPDDVEALRAAQKVNALLNQFDRDTSQISDVAGRAYRERLAKRWRQLIN